jgi:hypothetical protein
MAVLLLLILWGLIVGGLVRSLQRIRLGRLLGLRLTVRLLICRLLICGLLHRLLICRLRKCGLLHGLLVCRLSVCRLRRLGLRCGLGKGPACLSLYFKLLVFVLLKLYRSVTGAANQKTLQCKGKNGNPKNSKLLNGAL